MLKKVAIFIQPNDDANATQRDKERALCVLFTELSDCLRKGCEVNIEDPRNIIVRAPSSSKKTIFLTLK